MKERDEDGRLDSGRLKAMTDTFYAFSMTLLVFSFNIPGFHHHVSPRQFNHAIFSQAPIVLIYVLSFFLLAKFWMANHREFSYIEKVDHPFIWLNFINLMFVVFIPFSTDLIGEYTSMQIANVIFATNLGLIGMMHYLMWIYVAKNNLYSSKRRTDELRHLAWDSLRVPALSVVVIGASFFIPAYSTMIYLASPVLQYLIHKKIKSGHRK